MIASLEIEFGNEKLLLNNYKSIFWERKKTLILSDLHLGKSAHLRKNGIAIPQGIILKDLERLTYLIDFYKVENVIIVGDIFHADDNSEIGIFKKWFEVYAKLNWFFVQGNHDTKCQAILRELEQKPIYTYNNEEITFTHIPDLSSLNYTISGHIHPGITIKATNKQKLNLPCFLLSEKQIILPAFSEFTGLDTKFAQQNTVFIPYIITKKSVFKL